MTIPATPFDPGRRGAGGFAGGGTADAPGAGLDPQAAVRLLAERTAALAALRDVNERLRESEERFRKAFEQAPIGMALVSLDGHWRKVNASLCRIVGYTADELLATTFQAITHPDDLDADLTLIRQLLSGTIPGYSLAKRYFYKDGRVVWAQLHVSLVRDDAGRPLYFVSQIQDVTEARRKEMFEAGQRAVLERVAQDRPLPEVLSGVAEVVEGQLDDAWASVLLVHEGEIRQIAPNLPPALLEALGPALYRIASGLSQRLLAEEGGPGDAGGGAAESTGGEGAGDGRTACPALFSDLATDPLWQGPAGPAATVAAALGVRALRAAPIRSGDGAPLGLLTAWCRHARPPAGGEAEMLATAARLATVAVEHHQTTRRLAHLVRHDPLTGMPNRVCFEDRLQQATALARRSGRRVALFVLDVDHFKLVNDTLGHDAGDALLQQFALRLRGQLRETDTLARMGGDEFMVLLPELPDRGAAAVVAEKLVRCLEASFPVGGRDLAVTSSMGVAFFPDDGDDPATLQRRADEQMYRVKRRGRNGYAVTPPPA